MITGKFRLSFPFIKTPRENNGKEEYSVAMCFPKDSEDLKPLKLAAFQALKEKFGEDKSKWPGGLKDPFKDGATMTKYPEMADYIVVNAKSMSRPGLTDEFNEDVLNIEQKFYSGCYCRAQVVAYAYDKNGSKGVSFWIDNLQFWHDGEKLGGGKAPAKQVFSPLVDGPSNSVSQGSDDDLPF